MPRFLARHRVISKLKSLNLWRSSSSHAMVLPVCSRTGDVIEPAVKEQWFARSSKLFKICNDAVRENQLEIIPKMRVNLWNNYVRSFSTKDWCISRQLWWGQQIPAFECKLNNQSKWISARSEEEARVAAVEYFSKHTEVSFTNQEICIQQGLQ